MLTVLQHVSTAARRATCALAVALVWLGLPGAAAGQADHEQMGATLQLAGTTDAARTAFWAGIDDLENIFVARGVAELATALRSDSTFGLARVIWAVTDPGLSAEEQQAQLDRGVADAAHGAPGELAFALAVRAANTDRRDEATAFFDAATRLLPGDPHVAMRALFNRYPPDTPNPEFAVGIRQFVSQFPDFAPAQNVLAYSLYQTGERDAALEAVRRYVAMVPKHPNAHDSYGELLQWEGRLEEAAAEYRKAFELDPAYVEGYAGLADVRQLQDRGDEARAAFEVALQHATTPVQRITLHRRSAMSYMIDGKAKEADQELGQATMVATEANLAGWTRTLHRDMAAVDALLRDGKHVQAHLTAAAGGDPVARQIQDGRILALAGNTIAARMVLDSAAAMTKDNDAQMNAITTVRSLVLLEEGQIGAAREELDKGDPTTPVAQAILALCEAKQDHTAGARLIEASVSEDPVFDLGNAGQVTARLLLDRHH